MVCDRCRSPTSIHTMSIFNTDTICMECLAIEKAHPAYEHARRVEQEQVQQGNYNFQGVGLPADLRNRKDGNDEAAEDLPAG